MCWRRRLNILSGFELRISISDGRFHGSSIDSVREVQNAIGSTLARRPHLIAQEPRGPGELVDELRQRDLDLADRPAPEHRALAPDLEPDLCVSRR